MPETTKEINEQQIRELLLRLQVHRLRCDCTRCKEEQKRRLDWWRKTMEKDCES